MNPWLFIPVASDPPKVASLCSSAYNMMTQPEYCYQACYGKELSKKLCYELDLGNTKNLEVCRNKCAEQEGPCLVGCRAECCNNDRECIKKVINIYNCNSH